MVVQLPSDEGECLRVSECELVIADWRWPLAEQDALEIQQHWQRRQAETPSLFDGTVYLFKDYSIAEGKLAGTLFRTDFKTLLYWRSLSRPASEGEGVVREASGSSLIRSADGNLLFGHQAPGQLNSGRIYPPSGVIDNDDVVGGAIDIDASIKRELAEETGLTANDIERVPGYVVAVVDGHVTIGVEWRSGLTAVALRQRILAFLHSQISPELDDIVIVDHATPLSMERMPAHARVFARALLGAAR
jgi:8-oxo-dGTP pyrophosphatase MutT (NUDIX family)